MVPPQTEDKEPGEKEPREQDAHLGAKILAPRRLRKGPTNKGVQLPRRGDKERVSVCHVHLRICWQPLQASQPQGGCHCLRRRSIIDYSNRVLCTAPLPLRGLRNMVSRRYIAAPEACPLISPVIGLTCQAQLSPFMEA